MKKYMIQKTEIYDSWVSGVGRFNYPPQEMSEGDICAYLGSANIHHVATLGVGGSEVITIEMGYIFVTRIS